MDNEGIQEATCESGGGLDNDTRALGADGSGSITLVCLGARHQAGYDNVEEILAPRRLSCRYKHKMEKRYDPHVTITHI